MLDGRAAACYLVGRSASQVADSINGADTTSELARCSGLTADSRPCHSSSIHIHKDASAFIAAAAAVAVDNVTYDTARTLTL